MKKIPLLIIALLVIVAGYLYASPYLALNSIKNAAQERDADKISSYIDFPSVKQGVKDQLKAKVAREMITSDSNDGFEALGSMFATAMIDPIVDGWVTPDGIAAIMVEDEKNSSKNATSGKDKSNDVEYETSYDSFNVFHVDIGEIEKNDGIRVTMHRDGLSWKVTGIDLPMDDF